MFASPLKGVANARKGYPLDPEAARTSCSLSFVSRCRSNLIKTMVEVPSPSSPTLRRRRPGRPSVDTDLLRLNRVNVQLNLNELAQCQRAAEAAAMPLGTWARRTLLGTPTPAAQPAELRALWSSSSTLQSNTNQLVEKLNLLHLQNELNLGSAGPTLLELAELAPRLHTIVCLMRIELANLKGSSQ